jgi:hypothetical protein
MGRKPSTESNSTATFGFEAKLWLTADKPRNNMDAAEYKHAVLGLFLDYQNIRIAGFLEGCAVQSNLSEKSCPDCPPAGDSFVVTLKRMCVS